MTTTILRFVSIQARTQNQGSTADQAVTEVVCTLKNYQDVPDEQLKAEAARIMTDILKAWGVYVDPKAMSAILAMVEAAYQRLKEVKAAPLYKYQVNG